MTKTKANRHEAKTEIISGKKIETQESLVAELKGQGFDVTQATVSRDIAELKLQRVRAGNNISYYSLPNQGQYDEGEEHLKNVLRDFVLTVSPSDNLVVIKTTPGGAQGVAQVLDSARWEEILGTVAGDDTILIVASSQKNGGVITKKLNELKKV